MDMTAEASLDDFFLHLARAPARCLMLDFDGTLAPFHVDPAQARPWPGVCDALDAIQADGGTRLVIVSGRWSRDLLSLLHLARAPEIWGCHGWERMRPDGTYRAAPVTPDVLQRLVEVDEWSGDIETLGGRCEFKPASVAIHWRGLAPRQVDAIRELVSQRWAAPDLNEALAWHDFDGGIELRVQGRSKADAVEAVLAELAPGAVAAYLGDDATDEDAFRAINGRGLSVLVRAEYRATAAQSWIVPPARLLAFLHRWREASEVKP